jgi:hypothetical protein
MRKHLVWIIAAAMAVSAVGVASASDTSGTDFSQLKIKVDPSKLSKKKYKGAKLFVETSTLNNTDPGTPTDPHSTPVPTKHVKLKFDKDIKFTSKGLPQCTASKVGQATTTQAKHICGKAKVGGGSAFACVVGTAANVPCAPNGHKQTVVAFNGKPKGGNPSVLLWTNNAVTGQTTLPAVLKAAKSPYGKTLFVTVPPLGGGAGSITEFQTTIDKTFKQKGKTVGYTSAQCAKKSLEIRADFTFTDGSKNTATNSTKCTN